MPQPIWPIVSPVAHWIGEIVASAIQATGRQVARTAGGLVAMVAPEPATFEPITDQGR